MRNFKIVRWILEELKKRAEEEPSNSRRTLWRVLHDSLHYGNRKATVLRRNVRGIVNMMRVTLRAMYFPDEVSFYTDSAIRFLFSAYYIPIIAMVIAFTHSSLQKIVWVLVVPVTQDMQKNPFNLSYTWTLANGLWTIALRMLPFATLGAAAATIGHKMINCVGEAMVDAYTTQRGMDYPLLRARLRFVLQKRTRLVIFAAVFFLLLVIIVVLCHTNVVVEWSSRDPLILITAWAIIVVETLFVIITLSVEAPLWGRALEKKRMAREESTDSARSPNWSRMSKAAGESNTSPWLLSPGGAARQRERAGSIDDFASSINSSPPSSPRTTPHHRPRDLIATSVLASHDDAAAFVTTPMMHRSKSVVDDSFQRHALSNDEMAAVVASASSSSSGQVLRGNSSFLVNSYAVMTYLGDDWWRSHIHALRHIAFTLVTVIGVAFSVLFGPVFGLTSAVMILMYLNLPHLFGYTALSVTGAVNRTLRSFSWLHRHPDATPAFLILVAPYQLLLINAVVYFRRHPDIVLMFIGVSALLIARAIDLVREFDVSARGSVHWQHKQSRALLAPSLAMALEDAHEKQYTRPDVVSVDMTIDVMNMKIIYTSGTEVPLWRQVIFPPGAMRRYAYDRSFYAYTLPRLFSLQSPGYFSGSKFRTMRVVLRLVSMLLLMVFALIVGGMIVQAAFPHLRPIPVRVAAPLDNSYLTFDHIVVRMFLLSRQATAAKANLSESTMEGLLSGVPEAAHSAFKWNNVTTFRLDDDLYPQLCRREYNGTSVWELALLALAPYLFDSDELKTMLHFMNTHLGSDWVVRPRYGATGCVPGPSSGHQPTGYTGYFDIYSAARDTMVVAIRGTDLFSFEDFLTDINLFFEIGLYQFLTSFVPGAVAMPRELVVDLIRAASLPPDTPGDDHHETWAELTRSGNHSLRQCQQNNYRRDFFADAYNHIAYIGSRPSPPANVILTGHSLGGAVAAILAARMDIKAVAFSAPGVAMARKRFGFSVQSIHRNVMTVISSNDIVPAVGEHAGEIHHVECLAATRELCHAMEFMVGSLWRSCGSIRAKFPSIKDVT